MSRGKIGFNEVDLYASKNSYHLASKSLEKNPWSLVGLAR